MLVIGLLKFLQALVLRGFGGLLGNRGNLGLRWLPDGRAASLGPYNCRQNRFSSSSGFVKGCLGSEGNNECTILLILRVIATIGSL